MNTYDAVLFDLDGTLVDTAPDITDAVNALLAADARPPLPEAAVRHMIGRGTRNLLRLALKGAAQDEDQRMSAFARHYLPRCGARSRVYDGVEPTLRRLAAAGVKLAVVTNKEERFVTPVLDAHELHDAFSLVVCGDHLPAQKPDPLPLLHCLERLGVTPKRALMVGDSELDVDAARKAGIAVWAVSYGYNGGAPIASAQPDRVIAQFADVLDALVPPTPDRAGISAAASVPGTRTALRGRRRANTRR